MRLAAKSRRAQRQWPPAPPRRFASAYDRCAREVAIERIDDRR